MLSSNPDGRDTPVHCQLRLRLGGDCTVMQDVGMRQVIPVRSDSDELLNFVVGRKRYDRGIVCETHGYMAAFLPPVMRWFALPNLSLAAGREPFRLAKRRWNCLGNEGARVEVRGAFKRTFRERDRTRWRHDQDEATSRIRSEPA